ncbi:MAG: hypothetical protein ACLVB1_00040 [Blautia obeum]
MTLQRTDEVLTFTKEHYIDKTQELKKGIEHSLLFLLRGQRNQGKQLL